MKRCKSALIKLALLFVSCSLLLQPVSAQELSETSITLGGTAVGPMEITFTPEQGAIYTNGFWGDLGGVETDFIGQYEHVYILFHAPGKEVLAEGASYTGASYYNWDSPFPALEVHSPFGTCDMNGSFTILQLEYDPSGKVARFGAEFEARCMGGLPGMEPVISGTVKFNYLKKQPEENACEKALSADSDADGVIDLADLCQDTPPGINIDESGCSPVQFCSQFQSIYSCYYADFNKDAVGRTRPGDCRWTSNQCLSLK